jgi:hypothetical protein
MSSLRSAEVTLAEEAVEEIPVGEWCPDKLRRGVRRDSGCTPNNQSAVVKYPRAVRITNRIRNSQSRSWEQRQTYWRFVARME